MFKAIYHLIGLFLLAVIPAADSYAEQLSCDKYSSDKLVESLENMQIIDMQKLKAVQVTCLENYSGDYDTSYVRGLTQANFETKNVQVLISDKLTNTDFTLVFIHEITHAEQYINWIKNERFSNGMDEKLNIIHSLVKPQMLNASFQTIAKMERLTEFRGKAKDWYRSYINMQFCMEYQAYKNEAQYAKVMHLPEQSLPEHLTALQRGENEPLLKLLNNTLVKRLLDAHYSRQELNRTVSVCSGGETPIEWFSASAKALNLI